MTARRSRARRARAGTTAAALAAAAAVAAMALPAAAPAQAPVTDSADLEQRLARIEQVLSRDSLIQLLQDVDALRADLRELRGQIEVQAHNVEQLKQRQRELYLDIDRRMQRIESAAAPAPAAPASGTAAAAGAGTGARSGGTGAVAAAPSPPPGATAPPTTTPPAEPQPPAASTAAATPPPGAATGTAAGTAAAPEGGAAEVDPYAEQQAYQAAFDLLKSGRYDQAAEAFQVFLAEYPGGKYADNARYWLGETYYVTRRFEPAMREFQTLVQNHPESQKLTHAMLKIGYIHDELGQKAEAAKVLEDLVARYSDTTAAGLARKRLQRLRGE